MNRFATDQRFDRILSVEMFEHMRNYPRLLSRIASWMRPEARLFVHIFCHRKYAYAFGTEGLLSAIIIGPFPELYFGPPYLVGRQHHPVSFFGFCLLPFFASSWFLALLAKNQLLGCPLLNDLGTVHSLTPPIFQ